MPIENSTLKNHYYQEQIRKYMIQFMAIFSGIQVSIGKNDNNSETNLIKVPVVHGSKDRVVAALLSSNSPNIPVKLPAMSCNLIGLQMAVDRMKGQGTTISSKTFPRGGSFPDDIKTVYKNMPVPYYCAAELNILTSNLKHKYEILEQIMILFRPDLYIFTSDDDQDWTAINTVKLNDINIEENYPAGSEKRILSTNLNFQFLAYMSAPADIRNNAINAIKLRLKALSGMETFEDFKEEAASKSIDEQYDNIFDISDLNPPER